MTLNMACWPATANRSQAAAAASYNQTDPLPPSVIDLDAELATLTIFRRTPHSTREETKGSVARLASYRDGLLLALKSAGTDHWERHLTGDELVHEIGR